jgi:hypothetical protein
VELQSEFGDHALQPLSGIVEAMDAAGMDSRCKSSTMDPWERDESRENAP